MTMQTPKGRAHPSGRLIRQHVVKKRSEFQIPDTESNVPRLRPAKGDLDCVGFIQFPIEDADYDE